MQKLHYPLKSYIKAVEKIAEEKGLAYVKYKATTGSVVRFELFEKNMDTPRSIWVIHHEHNKKQVVWSKEDYRKAATHLCVTIEYLIEVIKTF